MTRLVSLVLLWLVVTPAFAQPPATNVEDPRLYDVASQLRCVVCQNLSVADSPSEMAQQMRALVRERLRAGDTPEQVLQYFVDKYGEWILLSPRRRGFNWLVWSAPLTATIIGLIVAGFTIRRWTARRRARLSAMATGAPPPVDPAMRERIRREMELEGER